MNIRRFSPPIIDAGYATDDRWTKELESKVAYMLNTEKQNVRLYFSYLQVYLIYLKNRSI